MDTWGTKETDWAQKYRPTRLEDMILPTALMQRLIAIRDKQVGPSMLFHGRPGIGKTTAAVLLNPRDNVHYQDCEKYGEVNDVISVAFRLRKREKEDLARRVVVMDAADRLSTKVQQELPRIIEEISHSNMFVFTANNSSKFIEALRSRLVSIDFEEIGDDPMLQSAMTDRAMKILKAEGIAVKVSLVRAIVASSFPDMRQVLKRLQFEVGLIA